MASSILLPIPIPDLAILIPELELKAILIPILELVPTKGDRASADMVFDVMLFQICYITAFLA